jgi:hypothetical protein
VMVSTRDAPPPEQRGDHEVASAYLGYRGRLSTDS